MTRRQTTKTKTKKTFVHFSKNLKAFSKKPFCNFRKTFLRFSPSHKVLFLRVKQFDFGDNIAVVHKCFLPALSVILTKRSVGRISRRDLARDVCEMFHFVQHDKLCFGQNLYYCLYFCLDKDVIINWKLKVENLIHIAVLGFRYRFRCSGGLHCSMPGQK